jgi:hypothetical protein
MMFYYVELPVCVAKVIDVRFVISEQVRRGCQENSPRRA